MERVKGIEPSYEAWEAAVLPLNYTRNETDFTPAVDGRLNLLSKCSKPIHDLRGDESGLFAVRKMSGFWYQRKLVSI